MEDKIYKINAYLYEGLESDPIVFYQNDTDQCGIEVSFYSEYGVNYDISASTVECLITKNDGTQVTEYMILDTTVNNKADCIFNSNSIATPGKNTITLIVYGTDGQRQTFGSLKFTVIADIQGDSVASTTEYPILTSLISDTMALNEQVNTDEATRINSENERVNNETTRVSNENLRISNEDTRTATESVRNASENGRVNSEVIRIDNETARQTQENTRINNENDRVSNESTRISEFNVIKNDVTTLSGDLGTKIQSATTKKTELDTSIANAQNDINTINSSAAYSKIIYSNMWVYDATEGKYKYTINDHNLVSKNLVVTVTNNVTGRSVVEDFQVLDLSSVVIFSEDTTETKVVLVARYYQKTRSQEIANAKEFGADNTGIVDCTAILQDLLDEYKSVYLPAGTYLVSTLNINQYNVLTGENRSNTKINATDVNASITIPKSADHCQLKDFSVESNNATYGIIVGNTGTALVQDTSYLLENININHATYGLYVGTGARGSIFRNVRTGDCTDGFAIYGTDCEFISCNSAVNQRHGFKTMSSNNRYISCKAFCCGMGGDGAGFKCQGAFNILSALELQQNRNENLVLYNAYACNVDCILDGAGWGSSDLMTYTSTEFGEIPIASMFLHNTKNSNIRVSVVNGRYVDNSYWKCQGALYSKYPSTNVGNNIAITTYSEIVGFKEHLFSTTDFDYFMSANSLTINNDCKNIIYGEKFNFYNKTTGKVDTLSISVDGGSLSNTTVASNILDNRTVKVCGYIPSRVFSNLANTNLNVAVQIKGLDADGVTVKYVDTTNVSLNDTPFFSIDLSAKLLLVTTLQTIRLRFIISPKVVSVGETYTVTLDKPIIYAYF